ncbi:MAG TPA: hypothetical protein VG294_19525 [Solirubrobacteraceae bacterium]|nr:hypothetical protein [Solirubrobacteraceae bacterium]
MTAASSPGYAQAKADFAKFMTAQGLQGLPKIGKPIPTGKNIDFVICGPAECVPPSTDFTQAATILGWHVKVINGGIDPAKNQAAMAQTVRDHPDAVIFEGLDSAVFKPQLAALKAAHIPVIAWQTTDIPNPPDFLVIPPATNEHYKLITKMAAAAAMVAANGKPNVGAVIIPAFPITNVLAADFKAAYKTYCPSCKLTFYDMPVASLGVDATARAVNFVRANPGINVLVMDGQDSVSLGLKAQLAAAGLSNIKDIGVYPGTGNLPNLASGAEFALIPDPFVEMGFLDADALARLFTGQSPLPDMQTTTPAVIWTSSNLPSATTQAPTVANYLATFKALWAK